MEVRLTHQVPTGTRNEGTSRSCVNSPHCDYKNEQEDLSSQATLSTNFRLTKVVVFAIIRT